MPGKSSNAATAVTELFKKKPSATMDEFFAAAIAADRRLKNVGRRSFNATYVLPLKRSAARKSGRATARKITKAKSSKVDKTSPRRRGVRLSEAARARARHMVLQRDQLVLKTLTSGGDPTAAYELAANIDEYVEHLAAALRK